MSSPPGSRAELVVPSGTVSYFPVIFFNFYRNQPHFYSVVIDFLNEKLSANFVDIIKYIMSPGIIIPVLLLLLLIIYFLFALVAGLKEANNDLTTQLMHVGYFSQIGSNGQNSAPVWSQQ